MATVYVEARPKGRPKGRASMIMWSRPKVTKCLALLAHRKKQSIGRKQTATLLMLLVSET